MGKVADMAEKPSDDAPVARLAALEPTRPR
jgi:hypothetical protein